MSDSNTPVRVLSLALSAVVAVTTTGCFGKGARGDYAMAPEMRPLEVPPDLNLPGASAPQESVLASSVARPAQAAAGAMPAGGFTAAGSRDEVFGKVGQVLESIEGVTIASRAQLLGSYDVAYEGSNFLVRVVGVEAGSYVSAVDPRGLPATDAAPVKLIAELQQRLGN
ncbi:hypothetical protein [Stenotrophomonas sp. Marseille-Q4652]|uniref:hypothetical protein n=1 Tax=Stenotrophomonas sp. Marseille-Q4652 TaxID=2866595 RepID=UPI001CE4A674|nr:hypothetical protein [Stenotrophomonas sp. Marseille-Q4652]